MARINILDQDTINKIAAGEVVERPASVVKELVENSIDAGATAVSVSINGGGTVQIRVTDNGSGFERDDLDIAFQKNTTSKIRCAEDLMSVSSLGFRGEALSSISAVSRLELLTKQKEDLTGIRYVIHGGVKQSEEEVGCPDGTTFVVNDLFYNTPVRRKFLKTAMTEAGYVNDVMERIALSNPNVAVKFTNNGKLIINTSGNGKLKDVIYGIYGREIAAELLEVNRKVGDFQLSGMIAKPVISRGNRNFENYFLNGRYIKNPLIAKAIEEAYRGYLMQNKYPFTVLMLQIPTEMFDVNVHPAKLEVRFTQPEQIYEFVYHAIRTTVVERETIPKASLETIAKPTPVVKTIPSFAPEPFEKKASIVAEQITYPRSMIQENKKTLESDIQAFETPQIEKVKSEEKETEIFVPQVKLEKQIAEKVCENSDVAESTRGSVSTVTQNSKVPKHEPEATEENHQFSFLSEEKRKEYRVIGQLFSTYWMVESDNKLYIIDQHAAHERVLYEKLMKAHKASQTVAQQLYPPMVISLNLREQETLEQLLPYLNGLGYEIEAFGGKEYKISAVPAGMSSIGKKELLLELLDDLADGVVITEAESIYEKIASMSCKAAVKGNQQLSFMEAEALIRQLMQLENPFHCPHGRPVTIELSKYEIEKKFKRIV